jgi:alpha-glucosidase (family GH31 glycosyl hydrolase)
VTPSYWSTDGYVALAVSAMQYSPTEFGSYPASWTTSSRGILWTIQGTQVDLYLAPAGLHLTLQITLQPVNPCLESAASMKDASRALWSLISPPPLPPRYAFGFLASRWGWTNSSYIEDVVQQFRAGQYPIDAIISDFEW